MKFSCKPAAALLLLAPFAHAQTNDSAESGVDYEIGGRLMVDFAVFDGVNNDDAVGSEWQLRRARLNIKHEKNDWKAELELNIDNEEETVDVTDGYIQYEGWGWADIAIGKMKEPFGLENLTSSLDISTMERSIATEAFAPGRNFGIALEADSDLHSWSLGAFSASEDEAGRDGNAVTGRFTLSPINSPTNVIHFGLSGSVRDMQGEAWDINNPAEVNVADKMIESREILADSISQFAVEAALVSGPISLQTEWMQQYVQEVDEADSDGRSIEFNGHYVLASFFLTGESRTYDGGAFDEVKPSGDGGAWEMVARYSAVDLVDNAEGVNATSYLLGVNYYATGRVRLMFNLARVEVEEGDANVALPGDSANFRIQYEF